MDDDTDAPADTQVDMVDVTVPLDARFGAFLRVTVSSVAADLGFTVDEIDDLRLAVSELFAAYVDQSAGERDERDRCVVRISSADNEVTVEIGREESSAVPVLDQLASTILGSVVDDCAVSGGGFTIVKRAVEAANAG